MNNKNILSISAISKDGVNCGFFLNNKKLLTTMNINFNLNKHGNI